MQDHFRRLGMLRKDIDALRLGDIQFFAAGDKRIGYSRSLDQKTYRIYVNRSGDPWEIPYSPMILGCNLQTVAPDCLTLAPRGFCVVEG